MKLIMFINFKADEIGGECDTNEQCQPLLANCVNKKCSCADGQHSSDGYCENKRSE